MREILFILITGHAPMGDARLTERAKAPHIPKVHSAANAGIDRPAYHKQNTDTNHNVGGYVNGMTFGRDYVGLIKKPGRVFPGLWPDKSKSFTDKYATDGPIHVPDIIALQPIRKAVKEAKEAKKGGTEHK